MSSSLFPHFVPIVNGAAPGGNVDILPTDFLGGAGAEKGLREGVLQITPTAATVVNLIERPTEREGSVKATAQIQAVTGAELVDGDDFTLRNDKNATKNFEVEKTIAATGEIQAIEGADLVDGETFTLDDGVNPAVEFEIEKTVKATGSIQAVAEADLVDGDNFTLDDGVNPAKIFEIEKPVAATGEIQAIPFADLVDGQTFTLDDGVNPPVVFEIDKTGDGVGGGNEAVLIQVDITAADVAITIMDAINAAAGLDITAELDGQDPSIVNLSNDLAGTVGNTSSAEDVVDPDFTVSDMAGGLGAVGVAGGSVEIAIEAGWTAAQVADAIEAAINGAADLDITAAVDPEDATLVLLENDLPGTVGNEAIVEDVDDAGFVVVGMTGGVGTDGVSGDETILIADDMTAEEVAQAIADSINDDATIDIVASINAEDPTIVDLVNELPGVVGNTSSAETVTEAGFTVSDMAGGVGVDGVAGGSVALTIPDEWTAAQVAAYLVEKINEAAQRYVASVNEDDPTKVDLEQQIAGTDGNRTNAEAVTDATFTVSNFAGGTGAIATHKLNGGAQVAAGCRYSERLLLNADKDYNVQVVSDGIVIGLAVASFR